MKNNMIYMNVGPLLDGMNKNALLQLVKLATYGGKQVFPFIVEDNNSAAFGFIPEDVMERSDFDEDAFTNFMTEEMPTDFPETPFTVSYSEDIEVKFFCL